jgi:ferredoxin-NADP reductase
VPDLARLRRSASALTFPLLPDDYLSLINPLWSSRELRGRVERVVPETDDAATLVIKPGWGWPWSHQPGQYVGIGVDVGGRWHWRSYSLTSPPRRARRRDGGAIAITVKAMPEGFLSEHLVRGVSPGTVVRLASPQGGFVLPEPPPPQILFLTAGSGITPVIGMLRTLDRRGSMPDVVLVHSSPEADSVLFRTELHELAERVPSFRLHEQLTRRDGRLDLDGLTSVVPDWREREAWVCGPTPLLDDAEHWWERHGDTDRLHTERFTASRAGAGGEGGRVTYERSGTTVEVDGATSLLEAGEAAGLVLPFGCRMGICHTCVVPLLDGEVRDLRDGHQHGTDRERIQTCISAPSGDCTIDA